MKTNHVNVMRVLVATITVIPTASMADLGRYYAVKPLGWTREIKQAGTYCFFTASGEKLVGRIVDMSEEMETGHFPKVASCNGLFGQAERKPVKAMLVNGQPYYEYEAPVHYIIDTKPVEEKKVHRMAQGGTVRFSTDYRRRRRLLSQTRAEDRRREGVAAKRL